jgi:hypothetical protein
MLDRFKGTLICNSVLSPRPVVRAGKEKENLQLFGPLIPLFGWDKRANQWTPKKELKQRITCSLRGEVGPSNVLQHHIKESTTQHCQIDGMWLNRTGNSLGVGQGTEGFWAQPTKIRPFTTFTGFFRIWPGANLLPLIWTGQYPIFFLSSAS